jgi:hypothetical protein
MCSLLNKNKDLSMEANNEQKKTIFKTHVQFQQKP